MINVATAYSDVTAASAAGISLSEQIHEQLGGAPDAVVLFAARSYQLEELLRSVKERTATPLLVGCSSAGEFISGRQGEAAVSAIAFKSDEIKFNVSVGRGLRTDRAKAASELVSGLIGREAGHPNRTLLLLTDALAGHTDDFIEEFNVLSGAQYQIFGGGAGDDARFAKTEVFVETEVIHDAAVGLEILSKRPLGIGVQHGWRAVGTPMRVTEADGMRLISLNATPAAEVIEEFAKSTGQQFDRKNPVPFFLHNTLGIETPSGFKLRVPLSVFEDGSMLCASNVPAGSTVSMMSTTAQSAADAASGAVASAIGQLRGARPKAALFFDCVATRLRMGKEFGLELKSLQNALGDGVKYAGCNSYGQVARVSGQFSGFHNCTAVVCVLPE